MPNSSAPVTALDLNADLGEGCGDDAAMLDLITSANIACGGHAGDEASMQQVAGAAVARGVRIGAHVSYPDRDGFGRMFIDLPGEDLKRSLFEQFEALAGCVQRSGGVIGYVKPHGALYHAAARHREHAAAILHLARDHALAVVAAPGSMLLDRARSAGLTAVAEGFADRGYTATGDLVPRGEPGAVLERTEQVAGRVRDLLATGAVRAVDGTTLPLDIGTLCLHGDTPGAVAMARSVREEFERAGIRPEPFT